MDYFHLLTVVNNAAVNIVVQVSESLLAIFLGVYHGSHCNSVVLFFEEAVGLFFYNSSIFNILILMFLEHHKFFFFLLISLVDFCCWFLRNYLFWSFIFLFFSIVCFSDPSQNSITGEHSQLLGIVFLWELTFSKVTLFLLILRDITPFSNSIFCTHFLLFTPQLFFLLFLFPTW